MTSLADIAAGGKRALAAALVRVEREAGTADVVALLDEAYAEPKGWVIGITGPPGVGKSTLINALIAHWRKSGETVGVIAVDPSSRISGGALLGDRARMASDPSDQGVFIRSLAARGRLGGLADMAFATVVLMRALFDRVLVESVGVGQSEAEIVSVSDTVVLCVQPGSGDALQFMKAGIMEIPAIAVVTKADMGAMADRTAAELKAALSLVTREDWTIAVLTLSTLSGAGVGGLAETIDQHRQYLMASGRHAEQRADQARTCISGAMASAAGQRGLDLIGSEIEVGACTPFRAQRDLLDRIEVRLRNR